MLPYLEREVIAMPFRTKSKSFSLRNGVINSKKAMVTSTKRVLLTYNMMKKKTSLVCEDKHK